MQIRTGKLHGDPRTYWELEDPITGLAVVLPESEARKRIACAVNAAQQYMRSLEPTFLDEEVELPDRDEDSKFVTYI